MNNDVLFSIIIPVYKVEKYLIDCLESVRKQTYKNYEVILVDDGSPDKSPEICDEYVNKDRRFSTIHKSNGGLSSARNEGIKKAKGKYIVFLDSDDVITPNALKSFSELIVNDEDVIITELLNVKDIDDYSENFQLFSVPTCETKTQMLEYVFLHKPNTQAAVQYIVKKEIIDNNKIYFEEGYYHEDNVWTPTVLSCVDTYTFYNRVWYVRRSEREGSITNTLQVKRVLDVVDLTAMYMKKDRFKNLNTSERNIIYRSLLDAMIWHLSFFLKYSNSDRDLIVKKIQDNDFVIKKPYSKKQKILFTFIQLFGVKITLFLLGIIKHR